MLAQLAGAALHGVEAYVVRVEVDIHPGIPAFQTVGLAADAVREGRDRVLSALRNCGFAADPARITVNLAPADRRKHGAAFDLPIALGLLVARGEISHASVENRLFLGELGLDGTLRPVAGALPMTLAAREAGIGEVILPRDNAAEASLVAGVQVRGLETLSEAADFVCGKPVILAVVTPREAPRDEASGEWLDLAEVRGQEMAKRALEVAAAGGHHLLLSGPPGAGKTLLARCLPGILPALSPGEALQVTSIHSAAGLLARRGALIMRPPFRAPHHTVSYAGLVGGGAVPRPGEITLAHRGVLFLDELPEFQRNVTESLRQPLEGGEVTLARGRGSVRLPAEFMMVAAMNLCPCGGLGDRRRGCRCTPNQIETYRGRVSAAILDRVDIQAALPPVEVARLVGEASDSDGGGGCINGAETSAAVRARVEAARGVQCARFDGAARTNSRMSPRETRLHCALDRAGRALVARAVERMGLSARGYHRVLRVARTIADLAGADAIEGDHLMEAVQYRGFDERVR